MSAGEGEECVQGSEECVQGRVRSMCMCAGESEECVHVCMCACVQERGRSVCMCAGERVGMVKDGHTSVFPPISAAHPGSRCTVLSVDD